MTAVGQKAKFQKPLSTSALHLKADKFQTDSLEGQRANCGLAAKEKPYGMQDGISGDVKYVFRVSVLGDA